MTGRCLALILAAGEGTRMRASTPKILHKIGGLPLICHVVRAAEAAGETDIALVLAAGAELAREEVRKFAPKAQFFTQEQRRGTAHAALAAEQALSRSYDNVLIIYGDTPLIPPEALREARRRAAAGADIIISGFRTEQPQGYGRLLEKAGRIEKIIEEKDASSEQKKIKLCNGGFMLISGAHILPLLKAVENKNAKGEYYLTDIAEIAAKRGLNVQFMELAEADVLGVNTQAELAAAEAVWQSRKRQEIMAGGVHCQAPETVYFSYDTEIAADCFIEPQVFFGLGVKIAAGAQIRAFSHIEGAIIGRNAIIGPYARLRPGSRLAENVRIGNFCELKQADIGEGAKINHLTYMGDAEVGAHSNIGAGTVSCNYDGYNKYKLTIGAGAFIGSNTSLVAPLAIGAGAYIASGSVITRNVEAEALAFGRARQVDKPEGGKKLRALFSLKKQAKQK